jgi:S1-C subfamily serine protease
LGRAAGVEVVEVVEGSPAQRAGIRRGDVVTDLDGVAVGDAGSLQHLMVAERIGRPVAVRLSRDGEVVTLTATPAELEG